MGWHHRLFSSFLVNFFCVKVDALTDQIPAMQEEGENVSFGKLLELRNDDGPKLSVLFTLAI